MFKRSSNAKIAKEKNDTNGLEEKLDKKIISFGAKDASSAISAQSPNNKKTIIGEGVIIEGKISGSGNLIIEGMIEGDVELEGGSVTVGPKGRIEGGMIAKDAVISGQVSGKINAKGTVRIARHADFSGEIKAQSISIDDGAFFKGKIEMDRAPNRNTEATGVQLVNANQKKNEGS